MFSWLFSFFTNQSSETKEIEEIVRGNEGNIVYDSDIDSTDNKTFIAKIMNKNKLLFLNVAQDKNTKEEVVFGVYYNGTVNHINQVNSTDECFVCKIENYNNENNLRIKYYKKKDIQHLCTNYNGITVYNNCSHTLYEFGGVFSIKRPGFNESYCGNNLDEYYSDYTCGCLNGYKGMSDTFTVNRVLVLSKH